MSQDQGPPEPPAKKIEIERNPTPDDEANIFSSVDEKREAMRNRHQLDIHDRNLGVIGKWTGSTNPSLNIAAAIAAGLSVSLLLCLAGAALSGLSTIGPYIERLIAAILTVGGFIFGVRQGSDGR